MSAKSLEDIVAEIRELPVAERLRVIERVAHEVAESTPEPPPVGADLAAPALLGLMQDEPELVDEICAMAYAARVGATPRSVDA